METKAGNPGAFTHFDLNRVESPAFVVDAAKLRANCQLLADIRDAAEIRMFGALKAFDTANHELLFQITRQVRSPSRTDQCNRKITRAIHLGPEN